MKTKTNVAIISDHSGSMRYLAQGALKDYNAIVYELKNSSKDQDILVTVVECGRGGEGQIRTRILEENAKTLRHADSYPTDGGSTPLISSINIAINILQGSNPYDDHKNEAYLVMVTTDGYDNRATEMERILLAKRIKVLQGTDKWTFVFRVPRYHTQVITNLGIHAGNVMEWDQTEESLRRSTYDTTAATQAYFTARSAGITSNSTFYTDLKNVPISEIKKEMTDITKEVQVLWLDMRYDKKQIRDVCEDLFGEFQVGKAYYQLQKKETVQENKKIIIKHKKSGKTYGGDEARDLLGLPKNDGDIKLAPGDHGQYEVFVQSTSVNRHVAGNSRLLYWRK